MIESLRLQAQIVGAFETPIAIAKVANAVPLIARLRESILAKRASHHGMTRPNIGG
jgi:hypothetical protein